MAEDTEDLFTQIRPTIAATLMVDEEQITIDSIPDQIPSWDSLALLNLILALECELNINIPVEDVERMVSVREIVRIVGEKL